MESDAPTAQISGTEPPAAEGETLARGTSFGRYVIASHVASGGAGTVYAAYDSVLDRRVALKLLHSGGGPEDPHLTVQKGWGRLVAEARMLARLNHPNVVAVYDIGADEGRPYLAMEFVEGTDLAHWLEHDRKAWRGAVDLVLQAGRGLAAAHAQEVIHGDFKPANVLVDAHRKAKVTDFGIARIGEAEAPVPAPELATLEDAAAAEQTARDSDLTICGTPAYMAPEQFEGTPSGELSDQYALAYTLFEAAYGLRPFNAPSVPKLALLKSSGVPKEPSDHDAPPWLYEILARALDPNPKLRFDSVADLLDAINKKLRRRRRPWVALISTVAVGATAVGAWAVSAPRHPFCASDDALGGVWDEAKRTSVQDAFAASENPIAADASTRVVDRFDTYATRWRKQFKKTCESTDRALDSDLSQRAFACLRSSRLELGALVDELADAKDAAILRAARAAGRLPDPSRCADPERLAAGVDPPAPEIEAQVAAVRDELARSNAKFDLGEYDESLAIATAALASARALDYDPLTVDAIRRQGVAESGAGDPKGSIETLKQAYYIASELDDDARAGDIASEIANSMSKLDDFENGMHWIELARIDLGKVDEPLGILVAREAQLLNSAGQFERSIERSREALALLAEEGASLEARASSHNDLGNVLRAAGRYDDALIEFEKATALDREGLGAEHPNTRLNEIGIAGVYIHTARFREAADLLTETIASLEDTLGENHRSIAAALSNLAIAHSENADYGKAVEAFRRAEEIERMTDGPDSLAVARTRMNVGITNMRMSKHEDALIDLQQAKRILDKHLPPDHPDLVFIWSNLGNVYDHMERDEEAIEALGNARKVAGSLPEGHELRVRMDARYAVVLVDLARHDEAIEMLEAAIPKLVDNPAMLPVVAQSRFALARSLRAKRRSPARVKKLAKQALEFYRPADPESAGMVEAFLAQ